MSVCSELPGTAEAAIKAQFRFGRSNGAMLLMYRPITSKLEGIDQLLSPGNYEHLRDKFLVTEIVTCSAYAMYFTKTGLSFQSVPSLTTF